MKLETQRLQPTYSPPQNLKWLISRNSFFTFSYLENEIQHQIKRIENSKRTLCFIICCTKCHTKVVKLLPKYIIYTYSPAYAHFGFWKVGVSGIVLMVQLRQKISTYAYIDLFVHKLNCVSANLTMRGLGVHLLPWFSGLHNDIDNLILKCASVQSYDMIKLNIRTLTITMPLCKPQ